MTNKLILWAFASIIACEATAFAQPGGPIFRGKVSETELIEALAPKSESGELTPNSEIKTRGIRPSQGIAVRPAKPASASLLITFETNSAGLTSQARSTLDTVARALKADRLSDFRFGIEGHADPRGNAEHNLNLSKERAQAVSNYLITAHGIAKSRLQPAGKGDRELMNPQNAAAPENRRVTIINLGEGK